MMRWTTSLLAAAPLLSLGACHAVILNAQGIKGSPASVGFQVDPAVARNCITINPCQQDSTIIRDAEIAANVVNQCGRTQLKGNIDVGENTENALSAGAVTQVKAGGEITVTIHQVNADGAGPFFCDLDETSNTATGIRNLTVLNNVPGTNGLSQAKAQAFDVTVKMPDNLKCTGASTGNVCTIRCRNNAVAGPFGGCFAVQQAGIKATANSPNNINTLQELDSVLEQVQINQADFGKAVEANKNAGTNEAKQNLNAVNALLAETITTRKFPQETPSVVLDVNQPNVTPGGGSRNGGNNGGNNNGGNNNGGNKNGGNKNNAGNNNAGNNNAGNNNAGNNNAGNNGNANGQNKNGNNAGKGNGGGGNAVAGNNGGQGNGRANKRRSRIGPN